MTNDLRIMKKELKSFAKRVKDFKYTDSACITFLLTGLIMLSGISLNLYSDEIKTQQEAINTSIFQLQKDFKRARQENNKLLRNTNLELIQLMEQGDHVVKSPWSSFQFGSNYVYNDWKGTYKGRGDKKEAIKYARENDKFGTYAGAKQGTTELKRVIEPISAVPVDAAVRPKNIDKVPPTFTVAGADGGLPAFNSRIIKEAKAPEATSPNAPATFTPPALSFIGTGFWQGWFIGYHDGATPRVKYNTGMDNSVVIENYNKYSTPSASEANPFSIVMTQNGTSSITATWTGSLVADINATENVIPGKLNGITLPHSDNLLSGSFTNAGLTGTTALTAFINELRDHDAEIDGNYKFTNNTGYEKIFLSHNPAGRNTNEGYTSLNPSYVSNGWLGQSGERTAKFTGTLELIGNNNSLTVGVEHQLWDSQDNLDGTSIFENKGKITLSGGKQVIGIMIDTEANNPAGLQKHKNNQTKNTGHIIINNSDSIGIDFGNYAASNYLPVDVTLGDIEINGNNNYGFRMKNIQGNTYYDDVTISGGASPKTVKVAGNENVGLAIGKSLSKNVTESHSYLASMTGPYTESGNLNYNKLDGSNPISNFFGINVTLAGNKGIGILRLSDYSTNNDNDFIFNSQNIGTFKIDGAINSTLLRTDKYGMSIVYDISMSDSSGGVDGSGNYAGNTIAHANGLAQHIYNSAKISTGSGLKNTTGLASTSGGTTLATPIVNIKNTGEIELKGEKSIGMYTGTGTIGENDGTSGATAGKITLEGVDANNIGGNTGIYNAGTFNLKSGTIKIKGGDSVGIYNTTGTTNVTNTPTINGELGATGIYGASGSVKATTDGIKINIDDSAVPSTSEKRGIGVYAKGAGTLVDLSNANTKIIVNQGGAGIYSTDSGVVKISNGLLDYNGSGYALYTDKSGTVDASSSTINLGGEAVGFVIDGASGSYSTGVNLSGASLNINSNDVILASIKNPSSSLNLSNFDTVAVLTPASLSYTGVGGTATDYKIGFVEGLNGAYKFDINQVLDKSLAVAGGPLSSATQDQKFTRNFSMQRSIIDVNADVKAVLSSSDANTIQRMTSGAAVVGLDISSTKNAASNADTQIVVNSGNTVKADRTDSGSGAIGLYTDYGILNVKSGATVDVETDTTNTVNDMAVGLYAVNGSKIENEGDVKVGGKKSIGILGLAYREDNSGAVIGNEFEKTDEGRITIENKGTVNADGVEAKGILIKNNSINGVNQLHSGTSGVADNVATNDTNGVIKLTGEKAVGIYADEATAINRGTIDLQGAKGQIGLYGTTTSGVAGRDSVLINDTTGKIKVGDSTLANNTEVPNIGIFTESKNQVLNNGTINVGENSYGIYAKNIKESGTSKLTVSKNGVGIFAVGEAGTPGNVTLDSGAKITVNSSTSGKEGVAVFTGGSNPVNVVDNGSIMDLKDSSFGYVLKAPGSFVNTNTSNIKLANDTVYAYTDSNANIVNNAQIVSAGDRNYGIYGNGTAKNYGTIDFSSGNGNVGMYATAGGIGTNFGTIKVSSSNTGAKEYGVGMATGYYNEAAKKTSNEGTIINRGTIEVSKANTMGMYAVGANSKAINYGTINLSGRDTIGMYLDRGAHGENWGTIQTTVSGLRGVKGIYLANGSYIKNYGTINIAASDIKSAGIWADTQSFPNAEENSSGINPVTGTSQTGTSTPLIKVVTADDMKEMGGVTIKVPPRMTPVTVTDAQGNVIPIVKVDTNTPAPNPVSVTVTSPSGITTLDLALNNMQNFPSSSEATSLGMYVDTSGVNYTNPIQGLNNLVGLEDISLYFGTEASRYTTSKVIEVGDNILKPYNDALRGLVTAGTTLYVTSPSITWMAQPTKDSSTGLLDKVYLVKVPYVAFAKDGDEQTYNFLAGLEKRYGVEGLGTQEKLIFDKISSLTGGEGHILAQAFDEMKGHQYSNIQQRTKETGDILSSEFSYLQNEWENPTKNNSKMKAFGRRGEYKTDTAGVVDYTNNAYGVAYVYEKEGVTLGNKSGWYAGAVTNRYEFRDLGKSKEDQTMIKAGIFKTISPTSDHNGSLTWTISGEAFAGINHMKRRYWIVDDTFEAKSNYATYGAALRNELGKDFRTSERTSIRPYGALNLEYGRYTGIKEYGPVALEIKGNDYISVQPEAGVSFNYRQPVGARSNINASLTAAYTNEIGEVNDVKNKVKLRETDGPYYELRGDKENRKGSGKFDLNLGFENTRFGVTVNAGYDTKGENVRGGIGFRMIY